MNDGTGGDMLLRTPATWRSRDPTTELGYEAFPWIRNPPIVRLYDATTSLLCQPSPVDSPKLRRLLVQRTGGVTLGICKAFERATIAAIREGREKIDLSSFEDPEIWRGVATPSRTVRAQPHATMAQQPT
jgi:hypothetical protein